MNDEQLDLLLRASNPTATTRDQPLTLRQQAILDRIIADPPPRAVPARRRLVLAITAPLTAVAAIFTVIAVSMFGIFGGAPAAAWGPAPLVYQPSNTTLEETIATVTERLRAEPASEALRQSSSTAWNLSLNDAGTPQQVTVIMPIDKELSWSEDLSGTQLTIVGEPFATDGISDTVPTDDSQPPGTVLDDRVYAPGEFPTAYPDGGDFGIDDFRAAFSLVAPDRSLPGGAVNAIAGYLGEWTPTAAQHADLLDALLEYDGLRLLGTTTDRLGREVIGIAAPGALEREATVLISVETGRIVGVEDTVLSSDDALSVPAGTVISYTLWKESE